MQRIRKPSWVYMLYCSDGTFYTGSTTNIKQRIIQHKEGVYEGYTKHRRPVKLVWFEEFQDLREAIDVERKIKKWSAAKKKVLISRNFERIQRLAQSPEMRERRMKRKDD
ncbi:MAG: GIY-YIG nuclease family protein [Balneolaceae bacterium]|nr:GIY-YIG nuclease family protein [Balneolaceae bacterium]